MVEHLWKLTKPASRMLNRAVKANKAAIEDIIRRSVMAYVPPNNKPAHLQTEDFRKLYIEQLRCENARLESELAVEHARRVPMPPSDPTRTAASGAPPWIPIYECGVWCCVPVTSECGRA